jgi:TorA maturation chaperone TorD
MKEVIIKIPDTRLQFFLELMQQLGIEVSQKYDIPEEHIAIVMDRMAKSEADPDRLENWEEVKRNLKFDA